MNDKNALLPLRWTMKQQTSKSLLANHLVAVVVSS